MRDWLVETRKGKGMQQKEVADQVSIAQATYSNIEHGKRRPSPKVAKKIAEVLGFDWTLFYED